MNAPYSLPPVSKAQEFRDGLKASFGPAVSAAPFGLLFGAIAIQNGMSIWEAMLMSMTVYGGASQMIGIELFGQRVAPWLIVASIVIVNARHVLYSAAVGRLIRHWPTWQKAIGFYFLVDPQYAESERRAESGHPVTFVWYMAVVIPVAILWLLTTLAGGLFGSLLPDLNALGLGFTVPIYFLAMVMSFRKRANWLPIVAASATASIVAFTTIGSPWHVLSGALVGILLAVCLPVAGTKDPL